LFVGDITRFTVIYNKWVCSICREDEIAFVILVEYDDGERKCRTEDYAEGKR